ncbi:MAG: HAD family hydrolase [Oleiphilus sp.]
MSYQHVLPNSDDEQLGSIKAVLFDLDGTLVHSQLNFPQIRQDLGCPEGEDVLSFVANLASTEKQQAEKIIRKHEMEDAHSARLISGANALLDRLAGLEIKTAIITRNSFDATHIKLRHCKIQVSDVLTREDAPAKPDPQALLHFSEQWKLSPDECVYVGDYLYDLQAANNAGMHACLFMDDRAQEKPPKFISLADFVCHDYSLFESQLQHYLKTKS